MEKKTNEVDSGCCDLNQQWNRIHSNMTAVFIYQVVSKGGPVFVEYGDELRLSAGESELEHSRTMMVWIRRVVLTTAGTVIVFNSWAQICAVCSWSTSQSGLIFTVCVPKLEPPEHFLALPSSTAPTTLHISRVAAVAFSAFFQYCLRRKRTTALLFALRHGRPWWRPTWHTRLRHHDLPKIHINMTFI